MQDSKGGLPTYKVIKEDVNSLIQGLPAGVLFNVLLYDGTKIEAWRPQLAPATSQNKKAFDSWFGPVNSGPDQTGIRKRNLNAEEWNSDMAQRLRTVPWRSQNYNFLVAMAALEQVPDVVYWFSDSLPSFENALQRTEEDIRETKEEYQERIEDAGYDSKDEYRRARSKINQKIKTKVEEVKRAEQAKRKKQGIPPRIYSPGENRALFKRVEKQFEDDPDYVGGIHPRRRYTEIRERDLEQFFERLLRMRFDQQNSQRPVVNAVIFRGADEEWTKDRKARSRNSFDSLMAITGFSRASGRSIPKNSRIKASSRGFHSRWFVLSVGIFALLECVVDTGGLPVAGLLQYLVSRSEGNVSAADSVNVKFPSFEGGSEVDLRPSRKHEDLQIFGFEFILFVGPRACHGS